MPGATTFDVPAWDLIVAVAEKLKKDYPEIRPPEQAIFWKTACFKEIAPIDHENFWYIRSASILRKLYMKRIIGVNRLRKLYGGRTRNHVHKKHKRPASGAIIRRILQQLEASGLVEKVDRKGRKLTGKGMSLLDKTANELYKQNPIKFYSHMALEEES